MGEAAFFLNGPVTNTLGRTWIHLLWQGLTVGLLLAGAEAMFGPRSAVGRYRIAGASLLLHELAHIRRGDYQVNLLQSLLETAFFFHPVVCQPGPGGTVSGFSGTTRPNWGFMPGIGTMPGTRWKRRATCSR